MALSANESMDGGYVRDSDKRLVVATAAGTSGQLALTSEATTRVPTDAVAADTLAAANTARLSLSIYNDSAVVLYVKHGAAATAIDYRVAMAAGSYYELPLPIYRGIVTGLLASSTGNAQVCEGI